MSRLLAIDLGNTNLKWGLFQGEKLLISGHISNQDSWIFDSFGFPHNSHEAASNPPGFFMQNKIDRVCVGSVQSDGEKKLREAWPENLPPLEFCREDIPLPIQSNQVDLSRVGVDRLLSAIAWRARSKSAAVIVDFGTAINIEYLSQDGLYQGGLIMPGSNTIARSLASQTSLLPEIKLEATKHLYGWDTQSAISRGLFGLLLGGVKFHLAEFKSRLENPVKFIATGKGALQFLEFLPELECYIPHLCLEGIYLSANAERYQELIS